ncbi:O-antigen ligase family protein [Alienimonas californiensis]|uniref:O-Antigen ligase n=1 Tax=Alienimonas californiensis TaxID=2527989 RepID=A0A517PEX7_9PLAN|nr:O-antigen ligase family protein [Alienimonas californiensis]QDT17926.1 O-Antigen ligase [Alienimonas californiensis]
MTGPAAERVPNPAPPAGGDPWLGPLRVAAGLSVAGRFLVPTEATLLGLTPGDAAADGWLSTLALLALGLFAFRSWRTGGGVRWGRCESLLVGLVLAHAVAAAPIFWEGGPRRAAAETVFNWAGLAATAVLLRGLWRPGDRVRFAALAVACGTAAAAVGAWQVAVSLPASRAAYLEAREQAAAPDAAVRAAARARLAAMGVPEDPAGRKRWEDRLLGSREPFGPFSLANTLAGVLLAAALLLPAVIRKERTSLVVAGLATALLVGVLLLTKSRTGYVGFAAGGLTWAALRWGRGAGRGAGRKWLLGAGVAGGLLLLGVGGAVLTGQLDREVISEAPRSLTFRLQYWTGTLRALAERPLLGTGPANLRPFYLLHKEAAASEAIAAPHNFVLDLWTSGGLLAPLLAAALAWCGVTRWRSAPVSTPDEAGGEGEEATPNWDPLFVGALAAFGLIGAFGGLLGPVADLTPDLNPWIYAVVRGWNWAILLAAAPAAAVLWVCGRPRRVNSRTGPAWAAACVGLAVHLLGADGAEFPAIVVLFLLALAAAPVSAEEPSEPRRRASLVVAVVAALLAAIGLWFVLLPGRTAGALIETAEAEAARGRDPRGTLMRADATDPLSDAALMALAESATAQALVNPSSGLRTEAVALWKEVLSRRPREGRAYQRLSDVYGSAGDWPEALEAARAAVALDPSAAAPWARLAESAAEAGDMATAQAAARAALERDAVTRSAGHADRVLPDEVVENLRRRLSAGD